MTVTETTPTQTAQPVRTGWTTVPKVNLLPPEIIAGRRFVRLQRRLAVAVLIAAACCGAATWWAQTQVSTAQAALDDAQSRTSQLQTEKARYAEVPQVTAAVEAALTTRQSAMASDVLWYRYLNDVALATSTNVWLTTMTVTLNGVGAAASTDPLAPAGIGVLQISGQTTSLPNVGGWLESLDGIAGVKGSTLVTATRDDTGDTISFSTRSVLTSDALSHRYDRKAS
jgi:hypothetical protein